MPPRKKKPLAVLSVSSTNAPPGMRKGPISPKIIKVLSGVPIKSQENHYATVHHQADGSVFYRSRTGLTVRPLNTRIYKISEISKSFANFEYDQALGLILYFSGGNIYAEINRGKLVLIKGSDILGFTQQGFPYA